MTKKALFIIPPERFNEDELFQPIEVVQNAGVEVTIASTKTGEITGDFEGKATAEFVFSDVSAADYDVVAVIGGSGTAEHLWGNQELLTYLQHAHEQNVLVTGICAGSVAVAKTGLLNGRDATCYPVEAMINELKANNVNYVVQNVVAHADVITSNGPDGAKDFGLSLVKALA